MNNQKPWKNKQNWLVEEMPKKYFNFYKLPVNNYDVQTALNNELTWQEFNQTMKKYGENYPVEARQEDWLRYMQSKHTHNLIDIKLVQDWITELIFKISREHDLDLLEALQWYHDKRWISETKDQDIIDWVEENSPG